jgi:hypothetical protein
VDSRAPARREARLREAAWAGWEEVHLDCLIPPGTEMGQGAVSSGPPMAIRLIHQIPNGQKRVKRVGQSVRLSGSKLGQRRADQVSARRPGARPESSGRQSLACFCHTHYGVAFIMSSHHRGSYVPSLSHFFLSFLPLALARLASP